MRAWRSIEPSPGHEGRATAIFAAQGSYVGCAGLKRTFGQATATYAFDLYQILILGAGRSASTSNPFEFQYPVWRMRTATKALPSAAVVSKWCCGGLIVYLPASQCRAPNFANLGFDQGSPTSNLELSGSSGNPFALRKKDACHNDRQT